MASNNLFKQISELIFNNNARNVNINTVGTIGNAGRNVITPNSNNSSLSNPAEFASMKSELQRLTKIVDNIPCTILDGLDVLAYGDSQYVAITKGRAFTKTGIFTYPSTYNLGEGLENITSYVRINTASTGTILLCIDSINPTSIYQAKAVKNITDIILAKIVINVANSDIEDDANTLYNNNYIVSGKDIGFNTSYTIDDDTKYILRDVLQEILAENIIGTIKINESLQIENQQGSVKLDSTSLKIYNDGVKYGEFNKDGVYFTNENGQLLSQYTKDGATIGNISITPNTVQSINFSSGKKGFKISDNGDAEFNNVKVRGDIQAKTGNVIGRLNVGTSNQDHIQILGNGTETFIKSSNFSNSVVSPKGFKLSSNGTLEAVDGYFRGKLESNVFVTNEVNVAGGDIVFSTSSRLNMTSGLASGVTTMTLESGVFLADNIVKIGTSTELIRILTKSGNSYTVTRGYSATSSAVFYNDKSVIFKIGEYDTLDKGYIELQGESTLITIHDVDDVSGTTTDNEVVQLGKLTKGVHTGKYGLYASVAQISGNITANSGVIGGWVINSGSITGGDTILYASGVIDSRLMFSPSIQRRSNGLEDWSGKLYNKLFYLSTPVTTSSYISDIKYCPINNSMYIGLYNANQIKVIDCFTNTVTATIPISFGLPVGMDYCPTNNSIYVITVATTVTVINCFTNSAILLSSIITGLFGNSMQYCPSSNHMYMGSSDGAGSPDHIDRLYCDNNTVSGHLTLSGGVSFRGLTYCPETDIMYASDTGKITPIDCTIFSGYSTISVSGTVFLDKGAYSAITKNIYYSNRTNSSIVVLDCITNTYSTVSASYRSRYASYNPTNNRVYFVNYYDDAITEFDCDTNLETNTLAILSNPLCITYCTVNNLFYNGHSGAGGAITLIGAL